MTSTQDTQSPVVAAGAYPDPGARARELETELAMVAEIMNRTGMTARGIKVTVIRDEGPNLILNSSMTRHPEADILLAAREHIRQEADATAGRWAIPAATLILRGRFDTYGMGLLGDSTPGTFPYDTRFTGAAAS